MWTRVTLLLVALAVASAEFGWNSGQQYTYHVTSTTLTGLQTIDPAQVNGLVLKAQLVVQANSGQELIANIENAQKATIQTHVQRGNEFEIPYESLQYQPFPLTKQSFIVRLKDGLVDELVISKEVPVWEVNIIRSILSQLQVNTQGKNLIPSKLNALPHQENDITAVYKVLEDTVEGECEVLYDITPLPKYVLQRTPQVAPLYEKVEGDHLINIVKTKNFTNCNHRPGYHYGITGFTHWEPTTNNMGNFLTRSSVSRVVVSGNLKTYTIQSSETTNQVILSPVLYNNEKSSVLSRVNLTLITVQQSQQKYEPPTQPQTIKKLVYDYNSPHTSDQEARQKWDQRTEKLNNVRRPTDPYSKGKKPNRFVRSIGGGLENQRYSSDSSSSESSSISTESWHQEMPKLTNAAENPFLPYFVGCSGHSIQHCQNVNVNEVVNKLSEQIGQQVQQPEHMVQANTLERFLILTRVIRTMNTEQLKQATEQLFVQSGKEKEDIINPRRSTWMTFRDAVAQAGTGPALVTIKEWIQNGKIQGEEAAQVVATLSESAMYPTSEYMTTFFELVKDPKVVDQSFLNASAIYSFTKLVRMSQVDRKSIHARYPVHTFGRPTPTDDVSVVQEYIPYFAEKLQHAIQQQDSVQIQAYIRALGNIAHPKILSVFEPYLEGKLPMTDFQRILVIVSLNDLARIHPRIARSVLYKTYTNVGEVHQVRVAAVYNLIRTVPPVNMLQRMAQSTHGDPSYQVRSAVKSAIESAALLKSPRNAQLSRNAQAAVDMLTPEVFGVHYGRSNITDFVLEELPVGYTDLFQYIGSEDSIIPSAVFYGLMTDTRTFQRYPFKFGAMVSSVQELIDTFEETFSVNEKVLQTTSGPKSQEWTYEKITQMLNMEHDLIKQVEGNTVFTLAGAERFLTFDNHTIEAILKKFTTATQTVKDGFSFGYQKLYNQYTIQVGFPTATGMPFVYTLETPSLLYGKGMVQPRSVTQGKPPTGGSTTGHGKVHFVSEINLHGAYATRTQSETGFVTPFDHQRYVAGLHQEYQINVPVKSSIDVNLNDERLQFGIEPYGNSENLKVFQYVSKQYTSPVDIIDFKPISEAQNTKMVYNRQPQKYEVNLNEKMGLPLTVTIESEKKYLDMKNIIMQNVQRRNMISPFAFPTIEEAFENTKIEIYYDRKNHRSIEVMAGIYESQRNARNVKENQEAHAKMPARVQEVLSKVQSGIKSPEGYVLDLELKVSGQRNVKYSTVIATGYSPVGEERKFAVRYQTMGSEKPFELCFDGATKMSSLPETDLKEAIQNQPIGQVVAELKYGDKCASPESHVTLSGKFERTQERVDYVKNLPQVQECLREMKEGNNLLPACMNATYNANLLNRYIFTVKYDNVPVAAKNFTYQLYSYLRYFGYPYVSEKLVELENMQKNKIDVDVHFSPDLKSVNTYVTSPVGVAHFENVRLNKYLRSILVLHPTWNTVERIGWSALRQQYNAYCTIDKTQGRTLDNMTYPIHLSQYWTPVLISNPKINQEGQYVGLHKLAILAKESSQQEKEVLIVSEGSGSKSDFNVVVHVKPASGKVLGSLSVNGQNVQVSTEQVYEYTHPNGVTLVTAYVLPTGQLYIILPYCDLELLYDRVRIQVYPKNIYRNRVLGLCGDYNGERFDFVTPKGKYVRDPEEFLASWTLSNDGQYAQLKERVEKNSVRKTVILTGVVSEQDAGRVDIRGREYTKEQEARGYYDSSSSGSSESAENPECMTKRVIVVERDGKHCFSTQLQPACIQNCQVEKTKPKTAKFVCVNKTQTSAHWAQMVTRGAEINLSEKVSNVQELTFQAPVKCSKI